MTTLLEKTFDDLRSKSPDVQDFVAQMIRDTLKDEEQWSKTFASDKSENWLSSQAKKVREAIKNGDVTDFDPSDMKG